MILPRFSKVPGLVAVACALVLLLHSQASAQYDSSGNVINVEKGTTSVDMIAKTSKVLHFPYDIPELLVDNQYVLRVTPISANEVLLSGLKPGVATITVTDANNRKQLIDVLVSGDVRPLELRLRQIFPNSNIRAIALETGVVLTGTIARADQVDTAMQVAAEYFPTVHNNMRLPDSQMIAIEVQVYEVARTKVRELGIDWNVNTTDVTASILGGGNVANTLTFSVLNGSDRLEGFLQALERRSLAKLLDKPTLVAMNGRPAEFLEGGEIPFEINQGLGNTTIQFRPFGTKLDVVPIVQGEGTIRLEVRAEVSEPSNDLSNNSSTPGFRVRRVNTGVDMKIGHTLALAGDIREEIETEVRGIPGLMNMPYVGSIFRRVTEDKTEIELIFLLTPRLVGEVDPSLLPRDMPARTTVSPSDCELYGSGYPEVPRCGPDCGGWDPTSSNAYPQSYPSTQQPMYHAQPPANLETVPPAQVQPMATPQSGFYPTPANPPLERPGDSVPTYSIGTGGSSNGFGYPVQRSASDVPKTSSFTLNDIFK